MKIVIVLNIKRTALWNVIVHTPMIQRYIVLEILCTYRHVSRNVPHVGGVISTMCMLFAMDVYC